MTKYISADVFVSMTAASRGSRQPELRDVAVRFLISLGLLIDPAGLRLDYKSAQAHIACNYVLIWQSAVVQFFVKSSSFSQSCPDLQQS